MAKGTIHRTVGNPPRSTLLKKTDFLLPSLLASQLEVGPRAFCPSLCWRVDGLSVCRSCAGNQSGCESMGALSAQMILVHTAVIPDSCLLPPSLPLR